MPQIQIELNGTATNPWHDMGLTQNPFPQLARYETDRAVMRLQALGGDPIPDASYIRTFLAGWVSDELIDLCAKQFQRGKVVRFYVTWASSGRTDEPDLTKAEL